MGGGWLVAHVVLVPAQVILVSAQVLLVLTLGLWTLDFGLGLDNMRQNFFKWGVFEKQTNI